MSDYNIGAKLAEFRIAKGLTQEELASEFNVSNKTVSKWENGQSAPDLEMLCTIARYFEVSTDSILGLSINETATAEEAIRREFSAADSNTAILRAFDITRSIIPSLFGLMGQCIYADPPETTAGLPRSMIMNSALFDLTVNSDDLNMAVMLLRNKSNFAWLKDDARLDRIASLLDFLGDTDALRICTLIHTDTFSTDFTAEYAAKMAGLPVETTEQILENASKIGLCKSNTAHMTEGVRTIYRSEGNGMILSIICLAFEIMCGADGYDWRHGSYGKMIGGEKG